MAGFKIKCQKQKIQLLQSKTKPDIIGHPMECLKIKLGKRDYLNHVPLCKGVTRESRASRRFVSPTAPPSCATGTGDIPTSRVDTFSGEGAHYFVGKCQVFFRSRISLRTSRNLFKKMWRKKIVGLALGRNLQVSDAVVWGPRAFQETRDDRETEGHDVLGWRQGVAGHLNHH